MRRSTRFSDVLVRLRRQQGFAAAFAFYKARGARRTFGMAFANYLNLEKGTALPKGERLEGLVSALGLEADSAGARELVLAYMSDVLGSEALLAGLFSAPAADPAPPSWLTAEQAVQSAISQRRVQLSAEQYAVIAADPRAYACHVILANTRGGLPRARLAVMTGLKPAELDAALAKLKAVKLAKLERGAASSPLAGKYVTPPVVSPATAATFARLREHRKAWIERHGAAVQYNYLLLRAPKAKLAQFLPHLANTVAMSAVYGDVEPEPGSDLFLVEGSVTRLFGR